MEETQESPADIARKMLSDRGLSIAELSRRSGVRYQLLSRVLNGYQPPSQKTRELTSEALGIDPEALWGTEAPARGH